MDPLGAGVCGFGKLFLNYFHANFQIVTKKWQQGKLLTRMTLTMMTLTRVMIASNVPYNGLY